MTDGIQSLTTVSILQRLETCVPMEFQALSKEFVRRWSSRFAITATPKPSSERAFYFENHFPESPPIYLRGCQRPRCLVIASTEAPELKKSSTFWKRDITSPDRLPIIITIGKGAADAAEKISENHALILNATEAASLVDSSGRSGGLSGLKKAYRERTHLLDLCPYNFLYPATGPMFFGRHSIVEKLIHERQESFAIAGPSRAGKTSIIMEYQRYLREKRDPRLDRTFYISLQGCHYTAQAVARYIATHIDATQHAHTLTTNDLESFLWKERSRHDGCLELLLDEVDEFCWSEAFDIVGKVAREKGARVILVGKSGLMQMLSHDKHPFTGRLQEIKLGPLNKKDTTNMLKGPLNDLGIEIESEFSFVEEVLRRSGGQPSLIQEYGLHLVENLAENHHRHVDLDSLAQIRTTLVSMERITGMLDDMSGPLSQAAALEILLRQNPDRRITTTVLQALLKNHGLAITTMSAANVCNELTLHHILTWSGGEHRIEVGEDLRRFISEGRSAFESLRNGFIAECN